MAARVRRTTTLKQARSGYRRFARNNRELASELADGSNAILIHHRQ
jgi:hypothetical protein